MEYSTKGKSIANPSGPNDLPKQVANAAADIIIKKMNKPVEAITTILIAQGESNQIACEFGISTSEKGYFRVENLFGKLILRL